MSKSRRERRSTQRTARKTLCADESPRSKNRRFVRFWPLALLIIAAAVTWAEWRLSPPKQGPPATAKQPLSAEVSKAKHLTLGQLVELKPEQLSGVDVAEMNLLCASGLPGSEDLNIEAGLKTLDEWARHVEQEIAKRTDQFQRNPARYDNSENLFKMVMLVLTLQEDLKVRYDPSMMGAAAKPGATEEEIRRDLADEQFFKNAASVFLTGALSDARLGTCASMPVLYAAIGRRLGFPLKLVPTKAHLFVRWDDGKEHFNIEGTGAVDSPSDEYYKTWPLPLTEQEIQSGEYLRSLSPAEELAIFLESRAACLRANGRFADAMVAIAQAHRLVPKGTNREIGLAKTAEVVTASINGGPQANAPSSNPLAELKRINEINRANQERSRSPQRAAIPSR